MFCRIAPFELNRNWIDWGWLSLLLSPPGVDTSIVFFCTCPSVGPILCYSHPDTTLREYSQSSNQDIGYKNGTALTNVMAQSTVLAYQNYSKTTKEPRTTLKELQASLDPVKVSINDSIIRKRLCVCVCS